MLKGIEQEKLLVKNLSTKNNLTLLELGYFFYIICQIMLNLLLGDKMELDQLLEIFIRCIITLITLFLLAKIMGKKQISQLNLYDYIIGISIGSLAADICLDTSKPLIDGLLAMSIYALSAALISKITTKSIILRRFFTGVPTVLIEKNKINYLALKRIKFDINDLLEQARSAGYYNLEEIEYAIMETSGQVSFQQKAENKPVTKKDMKINAPYEGLVANLIIDGKIMKNNLKNCHKKQEWLEQQLKVKGYQKTDDILLATLDENDKLIIYEKIIDKESLVLE